MAKKKNEVKEPKVEQPEVSQEQPEVESPKVEQAKVIPGPIPGTIRVKVKRREDAKAYEDDGTIVGFDSKRMEVIIKA